MELNLEFATSCTPLELIGGVHSDIWSYLCYFRNGFLDSVDILILSKTCKSARRILNQLKEPEIYLTKQQQQQLQQPMVGTMFLVMRQLSGVILNILKRDYLHSLLWVIPNLTKGEKWTYKMLRPSDLTHSCACNGKLDILKVLVEMGYKCHRDCRHAAFSQYSGAVTCGLPSDIHFEMLVYLSSEIFPLTSKGGGIVKNERNASWSRCLLTHLRERGSIPSHHLPHELEQDQSKHSRDLYIVNTNAFQAPDGMFYHKIPSNHQAFFSRVLAPNPRNNTSRGRGLVKKKIDN